MSRWTLGLTAVGPSMAKVKALPRKFHLLNGAIS